MSSSKKSRDLKQLENEFEELQLSLPKQIWFGYPFQYYQGFWCPSLIFENTVAFQTHFEAQDTDIILASLPQTGTTWLKSLLFTILNRNLLSSQQPFIFQNKNPHELVHHFEFNVYNKINAIQPDLTQLPTPRLFATHIPYLSLPDSIKSSKCRIVYVCRNPLDTFVSTWNFHLTHDRNKDIEPNIEMMEEYVDKFCKGFSTYGSYESHLLGYWNQRIGNPDKVLFVEYEGLKNEPKEHLRKLAKFLGCPFSKEEEKGDLIEDIIKLCSLESLKEMEVNKNGKFFPWFENRYFFRKGEVGDWKNELSPSMANKLDQILQGKLKEADFSFAYYHSHY
ncbi:unnamed protein product [Amaranthus hypochondriacus]